MIRTMWTVGALALLAADGCREPQPRSADTSVAGTPCGSEARGVVERLGHGMRRVSLLAPDSVVRRELADAYAPLVTGELLQSWQGSPTTAPGRRVSNPWPVRIDIHSTTPEEGDCRVDGEVIYVTSADTTSVVERQRVTMRVRADGGWRVSSYEPTTGAASASNGATTASGATTQGTSSTAGASNATGDTTAAGVVRRYHAALCARDYAAAYDLWGDAGRASGQTREQFAEGFAQTADVRATVGDSVRIEGAAGSQYATAPVVVDATLRDGRRQHFEGTYTLRRSMVDGATPEQRRWHIYSARLRAR